MLEVSMETMAIGASRGNAVAPNRLKWKVKIIVDDPVPLGEKARTTNK